MRLCVVTQGKFKSTHRETGTNFKGKEEAGLGARDSGVLWFLCGLNREKQVLGQIEQTRISIKSVSLVPCVCSIIFCSLPYASKCSKLKMFKNAKPAKCINLPYHVAALNIFNIYYVKLSKCTFYVTKTERASWQASLVTMPVNEKELQNMLPLTSCYLKSVANNKNCSQDT